jgi:hypothetical protein
MTPSREVFSSDRDEIRAALRVGAEVGASVTRPERYVWAILGALVVAILFLGYTIGKQHDRLELHDVRLKQLEIRDEARKERTR